jgi:hypothetical protein
VLWKNTVQVDMTAYIAGALTDYDVTTPDPNISTAENTQRQELTSTPATSALVYLDSNYCDYNEVLNVLKGGVYGVIYILKSGAVLMEENNGVFTPFMAKVNAVSKGLPLKGDTFNNFPIWINHLDYKALAERGRLMKPVFDVATTLVKAMPKGALMEIVTPYVIATGIVRVRLTERCSGSLVPITGALAADISILLTNDLDTPAVTSLTPVVGLDGQYDLILDIEAAPVPMTLGDWMLIDYRDTTGSVVNQISNRKLIEAEA